MPKKVKQTQQADETEDLDLQFHFPEKITLITEFQKTCDPVPFAIQTTLSEKAPSTSSVDVAAKDARREAIKKDLDQIKKLLAEHGGDWDKWQYSLRDFREQYKKQFEAKAHQWMGDSFVSAGDGYPDSLKLY